MQFTKVRIERVGKSWYFVDKQRNRSKFDQAIVDVTTLSGSHIEGYVVAVHGITPEDLSRMTATYNRQDLGIKSVHRLGRGPTLRRVRLMEGGGMEPVE
jgi:hypothetical protein